MVVSRGFERGRQLLGELPGLVHRAPGLDAAQEQLGLGERSAQQELAVGAAGLASSAKLVH